MNREALREIILQTMDHKPIGNHTLIKRMAGPIMSYHRSRGCECDDVIGDMLDSGELRMFEVRGGNRFLEHGGHDEDHSG